MIYFYFPLVLGIAYFTIKRLMKICVTSEEIDQEEEIENKIAKELKKKDVKAKKAKLKKVKAK